MSEIPYIYLFVREDLSHSQQIVQTAHAVDELNQWVEKTVDVNHMVLFGVTGEAELIDVQEYLEAHGIKHQMFFEPDMMAYTSIATEPLTGRCRMPLKRFMLKR